MTSYVYNSERKLHEINNVDIPKDGVVTIEEVAQNQTINYNYIIMIENVQFHDKKPIIFTREKAYAIFEVFCFCIRDFYVDPSAINWEFLEWYANEKPMDILSLPLYDIDYGMAKQALIIALQVLENGHKYGKGWFSTIFKDMPMKFKDEAIYQWAYKNNPDLVATFPHEHVTYDMFYNLSSNTYLWLNDVPVEYRDAKMCDKFLDNGSWGNKSMNMGYVPMELRTKELCDKHFKKSTDTIIYIPQAYITYDMCLDAAKNISSIDPSTFLSIIPKEYQTTNFWEIYLINQWYFKKYILAYVPIHLRNDEFIQNCSQTTSSNYNWYTNSLGEYIREKENKCGKKWIDMDRHDIV
jgi:hypothetical protein